MERKISQIFSDIFQLGQNVVGYRDDVAADFIRLKNVQQFPRAGPDQFRVRMRAQYFHCLPIMGTGSRPVSATRPANTDTFEAAPPCSALPTARTCSSVIIAVTFT